MEARKKIGVFLVFLWLFNISGIVRAQTTDGTYEVDEKTGTIKKELPFDKPFYLKIYKKKDWFVKAFEIRKLDKNGKNTRFSKRELKVIYSRYDKKSIILSSTSNRQLQIKDELSVLNPKKLDVIQINQEVMNRKSQIHQLKEQKKGSSQDSIRKLEVKIDSLIAEIEKFKLILKLKKEADNIPDGIYSIIINTDSVSSLNLIKKEGYYEILITPLNPKSHYTLSYSTNSFKDEEVYKGLLDLARGSYKSYGSTVTASLIYEHVSGGKYSKAINYLIEFDTYLSNSNSLDLKKNFQSIKDQYKKIKDSSGVDFLEFKNCYYQLIPSLTDCDDCVKEGRVNSVYGFSLAEDVISESVWAQMDTVSLGYLALDSDSTTEKKSHLITDRIENLQRTHQYIDRICTIRANMEASACNCSKVLEEIENNIDSLKAFQNQLISFSKKIARYKVNRRTEIMAPVILESISTYTGGHTTLETKGKFTVRPDFGVGLVSNSLATNSFSQNFTTAIPFMGVRFNFRPLDPNVPYSSIPYRTFCHRSSINIAFSLTSIGDEETRFDLYKNTSFLMGYGFRLSNALNLNAGAVFFNRANPDPLISDREFTALPYVGLSIDFEILEVFKDIADVFK